MALYACRECEKEISSDAETCPQCGAREPWASLQDLENRKHYDHWRDEEEKHENAYQAYIDRFMGALRFKKKISHHVEMANRAQREKSKYN